MQNANTIAAPFDDMIYLLFFIRNTPYHNKKDYPSFDKNRIIFYCEEIMKSECRQNKMLFHPRRGDQLTEHLLPGRPWIHDGPEADAGKIIFIHQI